MATTLSSTATPVPAIMAALSQCDRKQLGTLVTVAIDLLDLLDGDPDLEEDNEDCCPARDDMIESWPIARTSYWHATGARLDIGDDVDAEDSFDREAIEECEPELYVGGGGRGELLHGTPMGRQ